MTASKRTPLFVYGTLKRGCRNHRLLAGQQFLGKARTVAGYRLFDLGEYPGMIVDATDHTGVTGELWSIDADRLAELDAFEGVPEGLYQRASVRLLEPFAGQSAETYLYTSDLGGHREIPSGIWTE